jgi:hypothetical protein
MYIKTSLQHYIKTGQPMLLSEYRAAKEMDLAA